MSLSHISRPVCSRAEKTFSRERKKTLKCIFLPVVRDQVPAEVENAELWVQGDGVRHTQEFVVIQPQFCEFELRRQPEASVSDNDSDDVLIAIVTSLCSNREAG